MSTIPTPLTAAAPAAPELDRGAVLHTARRAGTAVGWIVVIAGALLLLVPVLLGLERYVIVGGSMEPTIHKGSVVFDEDVPVDQLSVGDVITYVPPPETGVTQLVTHRIVRIRVDDSGARWFRTKGDANAAADPWRFELGAERQNRVRAAVPFVGYGLTWLSVPRNRMLLIGIPAAVVALRALRDLLGFRRPARPVAA